MAAARIPATIRPAALTACAPTATAWPTITRPARVSYTELLFVFYHFITLHFWGGGDADVNECEGARKLCNDKTEECHNLPGGYKCVPRLKKKTKQLPEDEYDAENDDDEEEDDDYDGEDDDAEGDDGDGDDDDDDEQAITESSSFYSCNIGYRKNHEGICKDINECEEDEDDYGRRCSHLCSNFDGGYSCSCHPGYELSTEDATSCHDVDECSQRPRPCSHYCNNTVGSYACSCPEGLVLGRDQSNCEIPRERQTCANLRTPCVHGCEDTGQGPRCVCPPGHELVDGVRCLDVDECAKDAGQHGCEHNCLNRVGGYECTCNPGWYLKEDNRTCQDIDECVIKSSCEHECVNTPGSFLCRCPGGFRLGEDGSTCWDVDECKDASHECSHACRNERGNYTCSCPEGMTLAEDRVTCVAMSCEQLGCTHGCVRGEGCHCPDGYDLLDDRKTCKDRDECLAKTNGCSHLCVNTPGSYKCDCPLEMVLLPGGRICTSGGCAVGMKPGADTGKCEDIDECLVPEYNRCSHLCVNLPGTYRCECPEGLSLDLDGHSCRTYDPCRNSSCEQKCFAKDETGFECGCHEGYELEINGYGCKDVDECANGSKHGCSHECVNSQGSYECSCPADRSLGPDNRNCLQQQKNDDKENRCASEFGCSHTCEEDGGRVRCGCPEGYELSPEDEKTCRDVNECQEGLYACSQRCVNTEGSYRCECEAGYELLDDKWSCSDVDECYQGQHDCADACVNTAGSYICSCLDGYALNDDNRTCSDIDECQEDGDSNPCEFECVNHEGGYSCECPQETHSLHRDNKTCLETTRCQGDHGCSHECHVVEGLNKCQCPDGYVLADDAKSCRDVDECSINNGGCSHGCENAVGSYRCTCPGLHRLLEDGRLCVEINDCYIKNGGCSHRCGYEHGATHCSCPEGMKLAEDGRKCLKDDECARDNGGCSHLCEVNVLDNNNVTSCSCPSGMRLGPDNRTCADVDECLENLDNCTHGCVNTYGGYDCSCGPGFERNPHDRALCDDVNECFRDNGNCSHVCNNTVGGYHCSCFAGSVLAANGLDCLESGVCGAESSSCSHYCHVDARTNAVSCSCPRGFRLKQDLKTCVDIDECEEFENDVGAGGSAGCSHTCVNVPGSYHCSCPAGYTLSQSDKKSCVDLNECLEPRDHNCSHDCVNLVGSYLCTCREGHYLSPADNSSCLDIDECAQDNGGCSKYCNNTSGAYHCYCPAGFRLDDDEKTCLDVDECEEDRTICFHECLNTLGSYECVCPDGYALSVLDRRTCIAADRCELDNGGCSHTCYNVAAGIKCTCPLGWYLDADEKTCLDVDECAIANGDCPELCENTEGGHRCTCQPGHVYQAEYNVCVDLDECAHGNNGGCSHHCRNTKGAYYCQCPEGLRLLDSDNRTCVIDECEDCGRETTQINSNDEDNDNPCDSASNGGCEQICQFEDLLEGGGGGKVICSCRRGYRVSETNSSACVDIDECSEAESSSEEEEHGCEHECVNTPGSYECRCKPGFELRDGACHDVDECQIDNGNCEQYCINGLGSYTCSCYSGYYVNRRNTSQCLAVNECLYQNGGCNGDCVSTNGSYYCVCADDLVLADDKRTCVPRERQQRCPAFPEPEYGETRCPEHPSGAQDYPVGAKCHARCRRGFRLEGSYLRTCQSGGRWDGEQPRCLRRAAIATGSSNDYYYQPSGGGSGSEARPYYTFERHRHPHYAIGEEERDDEPPERPYIRCPNDMDVELPPRSGTMRIAFSKPKTNVDFNRYVEADPAWGKQLQADLSAGDTIVTFTARTPVSNNTASCRLMIRIRDLENPQVLICPQTFEVLLNPGERERKIFWQDPVFHDNVDVKHIYKSRSRIGERLRYPQWSTSGRFQAAVTCATCAPRRVPMSCSSSEPRPWPAARAAVITSAASTIRCGGRRHPRPVAAVGCCLPRRELCIRSLTKNPHHHHHHHHHHRGQRQGGGGGSGGGYYGSTGSGTGLAGYFPLLTFNLPPQSLLEGAFALAFVVVLAVPLFSRIQKLLEESKRKRQNENNEIVQEIQKIDALLPPTDNPTVVMHYPSRNFMSSVSSSNSSLNLDQSTVRIHEFTDDEFLNEFEAGHRHNHQSSNNHHHHSEKTHTPGNVVLEEDDDGAEEEDKIDYKAYRHRLMEEVLKKYYDEQQPPGNVVMNSFCLNTVDDHRDIGLRRVHRRALQSDRDREASRGRLHAPDGSLFGARQYQDSNRGEVRGRHVLGEDIGAGGRLRRGWRRLLRLGRRKRGRPASIAETKVLLFKTVFRKHVDEMRRRHRRVDERPKTGHHAARLPRSAPKTASGRNTSVRISSMSYPRPPPAAAAAADVLRIDREDSSSDLDSSVNDMHANKSKMTHNKVPTTTSDGKRPWIAASKGDTANRKYATQDRFTRRWEMRSHQRSATEAHHNQAHHQHHQAQAQASLESLGSNVASQSTLLLPNRKLTLQEREDRLFGVTRDVEDHGGSYTMEKDKRRPGSSKNKSWGELFL
ncbi:unnamed protein product [Trichogramma brassicae]|uniref:Fibrillin-2 n=1 Tax=Trichogramma brassicae TaxID=86971 RepID=A0A6H5HU27_9HYME|nr:unnamed protein product [Trichogramma brassicae]